MKSTKLEPFSRKGSIEKEPASSLRSSVTASAQLPERPRKGQTAMIMIVLVMIIFAGIGIFLLTVAQTVSQVEYMNTYVHSLLIAMLKTDTGYLESSCKQVSDLLGCSFFESGWRCAGNGPPCFDLANQTITEYMQAFDEIKPGYRYLFLVEPEGFVALGPDGKPLKIRIGDASLETARIEKLTADERIQRTEGNLKVKLIMAREPRPARTSRTETNTTS